MWGIRLLIRLIQPDPPRVRLGRDPGVRGTATRSRPEATRLAATRIIPRFTPSNLRDFVGSTVCLVHEDDLLTLAHLGRRGLRPNTCKSFTPNELDIRDRMQRVASANRACPCRHFHILE